MSNSSKRLVRSFVNVNLVIIRRKHLQQTGYSNLAYLYHRSLFLHSPLHSLYKVLHLQSIRLVYSFFMKSDEHHMCHIVRPDGPSGGTRFRCCWRSSPLLDRLTQRKKDPLLLQGRGICAVAESTTADIFRQ